MSNWPTNGNLMGKLSIGQGEPGKSLEYMWRGTELGIRVEGEEEYQFVNLAGGGAGNSGADGREIELQVGNGFIQWRYAGEEPWNNLIELSALEGKQGPKGDKGEQGLTGATGPQGERGPQGEQGPKGETGLQGLPGKDGKNGIDGTNGINGQDGANGKDGVTPNITIGTVTTLEAGEEATVTREGTNENPIFNFKIPRGRDAITTLTRLTIDNDNTLNLTKDKWQKVNMANDTTINLPEVNDFTEIHLFFRTNSALTLTLPNSVVWKNKPTIEANKVYEFVFTYIDDNEWIAGCITYSDSEVSYI